jgi:benzoyl-CoA reductase subunit B
MKMVAKERKANRLKTGSLVGQYLNTYLDEIRRAPQEGKLVAYTCGFPIWFMLSAQDIAYVHGEGYGAFSSARKWERPFMEASAAEGVSEELCSYSRTHFGCALMSQRDVPANFAAPESLLPEPQLAATVHSICSTELAWARAFNQLNKVPTFVVEVPYIQDVEDEERHHKTMVSRLKDFVSFIEDVSGRPYNWERLYELMTVIKKAATVRAEGLDLGSRHVPAPGTFFDWGVCLGPINYLAGRPETIDFYEQLKAEIEDRAAHNIGAVPDEKYRVLWEGIMFWPKVGQLSEKFAEANCSVIGGSYSHLSFWLFPDQIDLERPLDTIATFVLGVF